MPDLRIHSALRAWTFVTIVVRVSHTERRPKCVENLDIGPIFQSNFIFHAGINFGRANLICLSQ